MIGQAKLIEKINSIDSLDKLPKSIIINGNKGMGRHTLFNYIKDKFNVESKNIDYELSLDILNDMYALSIPRFYLIDFDTLSEHKQIERFQNTLLKFIEEPPELAWIFIINSKRVLDTIFNRCQVYTLEPYSKQELKELAQLYSKNYSLDELILLETPYNIINKDISDLKNIEDLCYNIINNIDRATVSNALSIRNKFEKEMDLDLFLKVFSNALFMCYIKDKEDKYLKAYFATLNIMSNLNILNINKNNIVDNYLLNLKIILHD